MNQSLEGFKRVENRIEDQSKALTGKPNNVVFIVGGFPSLRL
jgi:hypothetical protein